MGLRDVPLNGPGRYFLPASPSMMCHLAMSGCCTTVSLSSICNIYLNVPQSLIKKADLDFPPFLSVRALCATPCQGRKITWASFCRLSSLVYCIPR